MNINAYAIDIETFTGTFADGSQANGLDPMRSRVESVAVWGAADRLYLEAASERALLDQLAAFFHTHREGTLLTWNGAAFDLPFLLTRARECGSDLVGLFDLQIDPTLVCPYGPLPGHEGAYRGSVGELEHVDVMHLWRQWAIDRDLRPSLKPVAREFGIDVLEVDRTHIHDLDPMDLIAYNFSDVRATFELWRRAATRSA